jgi:hypothetical protein
MSKHQLRKNAKLYAYLEGYEACQYTGLPLERATKSFIDLVIDESVIELNSDDTTIREDMRTITSLIQKFLMRYYDRMKNMPSDPRKVKLLAENSKESFKNLEDFVSSAMSLDSCPLEQIGFMNMSDNATASDICNKCPWYLTNKKHCLMFLHVGSDDFDYKIIKHLVPEYKYLELAIMKLVYYLYNTHHVPLSKMNYHHDIFMSILSCGQIYELMNPTGEAREEYIQKALSLLTKESIDYTSDEYNYYLNLLHEVFNDIQSSRLPYIQEIRKALNSLSTFLHSPFDEEKDYYYSMKGTGQSGYTKERYSLQSSAFEVDIHKNDQRVAIFDQYIGYKSHYSVVTDSSITTIRTIAINNPSKFKTRMIHIADNPLQDRCNWLQHRLSVFLDRLSSDSTTRQEQGRSFLKDLTYKWYATENPLERIGIYCTDFSNATDTIDQRFTHEVLTFIFGTQEVANFWDYCSQLDKELCHADGSKELYHQKSGQPQGLLASFDIFALCHHFLFLMDMKENGLENYTAPEYYRVLGDDAIYNTIIDELEFIDHDSPLYDSEHIERSSLELSHFHKCSIFAGLIINYDKSRSAHYDSSEARLDFAKVTYRNGELFSPIPFRLAMRYSQSFDDRFAVLLWRADRGDIDKALKQLDIALLSIDDDERQLYYDIIRCGELPYLDNLSDQRNYDSDWLNLLRYAVCMSLLTVGLASVIETDRVKSNSGFDLIDESLNTIFTPQQRLRINNIDPNHKLMILLEDNARVIQALHDIYEENDFDDRFMSMILSALFADEKEETIWLVYELTRVKDLLNRALKPDSDVIDKLGLPSLGASRDYANSLRKFANHFFTRGVTKRPRECTNMLRRIINLMQEYSTIVASRQCT